MWFQACPSDIGGKKRSKDYDMLGLAPKTAFFHWHSRITHTKYRSQVCVHWLRRLPTLCLGLLRFWIHFISHIDTSTLDSHLFLLVFFFSLSFFPSQACPKELSCALMAPATQTKGSPPIQTWSSCIWNSIGRSKTSIFTTKIGPPSPVHYICWRELELLADLYAFQQRKLVLTPQVAGTSTIFGIQIQAVAGAIPGYWTHLWSTCHCRLPLHHEGDKIFVFGFSCSAFTAWFLARMISTSGLLSTENEEMAPFAHKSLKDYETGSGAGDLWRRMRIKSTWRASRELSVR